MAEVPGQAKVPPVVPLSDTDPDRKEMYGKAADVFKEEREKLQMGSADTPAGVPFVPGTSLTNSGSPGEPEEQKIPEPEVLPEDKHAFVRALLSDRQFEKTYKLFGAIEAVFVDRTTDDTTKLFARLDKIEEDEAWSLEADKLCLVTTLRELLKRPQGGRNTYSPTEEWDKRLEEFQKLSRPLYDALINVSRDFEALVKHMVSKAADPDFWPGGVNALPSRRTAAG
jgi:hypothetical protein